MTCSTIHVCIRCKLASSKRRGGYETHGLQLRDALIDALEGAGLASRFRIAETACLGGCNRRCRISIADPARWSWLLADLRPDEQDAGQIIRFLEEWLAAEDGLIPKTERSAWLVSHAIGRMPPFLPDPQHAASEDDGTKETTTT